MAKKTTTAAKPNLGARGQANLSIVAAAGQRYAPIKTDISGYMKALGTAANLLVQRKNNAIERAQDIDISGDIIGSEKFQDQIKTNREDAANYSKIMKNTLPFTKKHKDAKKEFEKLKSNIQEYKAQFEVIDQISTNLGGMVKDGRIQMSVGEDEIKQNYYLALHNKDFGEGFDPDGNGPKEAVPFFTMEDGKMKMVNVNGDYVDPKLIKVEFEQSGDELFSEQISKTKGTISNTNIGATHRKNLIQTSVDKIFVDAKDNPAKFNEHLMTTEYSLQSQGGKRITFMDSYLENVLKDEGIDQGKLPKELLDQLREFNIDEETVIAKQMLFKSIKQYDTDFMDDVENYYMDHFNTIE
tara:strand:+ start:486 stop:1550 length:1065 start_codon:yes stop_codon:yes gene_type:complete